jgi:peptide chain release factor 1
MLDAIMNDGLLDEVVDPLIADHQSKLMEASGV